MYHDTSSSSSACRRGSSGNALCKSSGRGALNEVDTGGVAVVDTDPFGVKTAKQVSPRGGMVRTRIPVWYVYVCIWYRMILMMFIILHRSVRMFLRPVQESKKDDDQNDLEISKKDQSQYIHVREMTWAIVNSQSQKQGESFSTQFQLHKCIAMLSPGPTYP